jgi:hypothetical protein
MSESTENVEGTEEPKDEAPRMEREHGSAKTEVRADGSTATFSDPAEGRKADKPAQRPEAGTDVEGESAPDENREPEENASE